MAKTIYSLIDPRTNEVRWVGATTDIKRRVREHGRHRGGKEPCHFWIAELRELGLKPEVEVLAIVGQAQGEWEPFEQHWISIYRALGMPLLNIMDGGVGASPGLAKTPETRAKMAAAATGRTLDAATRAKIGEKARARQVGRRWSRETRSRMALAQQARRQRERAAKADLEL